MRHSALWLPLAALLLLAPLAPARAQTTIQPRTMSVSGSADVRAVPDVGMVQLGVTSRASNAQTAMAKNNALTAQVVAALKQLGIPDTDLQTSSINLSPIYNNPPPANPPLEPQLIGFEADNTLVARLTDLTKLGPAIDAAVGAGANQIQGISFALSDEEPFRLSALQQAGAQARAKALALAVGLGIALGDVETVSESGVQVVPVGRVAVPGVSTGAVSTPTPVLPGEMVVHADVQVQFLIK
jgi:uncharacterized protein